MIAKTLPRSLSFRWDAVAPQDSVKLWRPACSELAITRELTNADLRVLLKCILQELSEGRHCLAWGNLPMRRMLFSAN